MIQIHWTCASLEEARCITQELLQKKWIACGNLIPSVESHYVWEGKLEVAREVKVLFKTKEEFYSKILEYIVENGSYDVPEVSKIEIAETNPKYIGWLNKALETS